MFLVLASFATISLFAADGKTLAKELGLSASSKASTQWNRVFKKKRKMKKYGINKFITEPIYGDSLIKLLQDIQDESWRTEYMNLK